MRQSDLPENTYVLLTDSQELDCICAYLGIVQMRDDITAALVAIRNGGYEAVYLTEGVNFKRSAHWNWEAARYYADDIPDELDLQE